MKRIGENINRIGELAAKIAEGMRGSCTFEYVRGYPPLVCDDQFTDYFIGVQPGYRSAEHYRLAEPTMGGEDMAYFLQEVPGTFFMLGSAKETGEYIPITTQNLISTKEFYIWAHLFCRNCL